MGTSTSTPADPAPRLATEWLLADGLGGYAMGTALGANTRRYHGLLVAAAAPPVDRIVALHSLVEQIETGGETISFAAQHFGDPPRLDSGGWAMLASFNCDEGRSVRWTWKTDGIELVRTLRLGRSDAAARIDYDVRCDRGDYCFRVRPFTPLRDFHSLVTVESDPPAAAIEMDGDGLRVTRGGVRLDLASEAGLRARIEPQWWRDIAYPEDRARGQDGREHIWSPGVFELKSSGGAPKTGLVAILSAPTAGSPVARASRPQDSSVARASRPQDSSVARASRPCAQESAIQADRTGGTPVPPEIRTVATSLPPSGRLARAAAQFLVRRPGPAGSGHSIIAGYPWFADWGRDAMISLPGLLLVTGRHDEALSVLQTFAGAMRRGLVPNRFDDRGGDPEYNTVDASLWFVHAVCECGRARGGDVPDDLVNACRAVVRAYRAGTDFGIRLDDDGLITAGDATTQLTWMDAARDGVVFTPRAGKAIEINALWHHALLCLAEMTSDEQEATDLRETAVATSLAIQASFWWPQRECLHDVLVPAGGGWAADTKLRPNQIIAAALRHSPLTREQCRAVVSVVGDRLLTPFGLRTLDPADPDYRGRYEGDLFHRDAAYHNGTAWPWLLGPYAEAVLRAGDFSDAARAEARQVIQPLLGELDRGCLGQLAEVYDGDAPQRPSGCPAQAWSVAEVLRVLALIDDVEEFTAETQRAQRGK